MIRKILISIAAVFVFIALALCSLFFYLSTDDGQRKLHQYLIGMLSDALQTNVSVNYVEINPFRLSAALYGAEVDDRQGVRMLHADTLVAGVSFSHLMRNEIYVSRINLTGADLKLYKERKDTAANYQFVIDAFKPKEKKVHKTTIATSIDKAELKNITVKWDVLSERVKGRDTIDANHLDVKLTHAVFRGRMPEKTTADIVVSDMKASERKSGMNLAVGSLSYRTMRHRNLSVLLRDVLFRYKDKRVSCKSITMQQMHGYLSNADPLFVKGDSLTYYCNNGKPRKNHNRPNRGAFDPGHLNLAVSFDATLRGIRNDTVSVSINSLSGIDKASGLKLKNVQTHADVTKEKTTLTNTTIALPHSSLHINRVDVRYSANQVCIDDFHLNGRVVLKDLAQPFSPHLSNFTTPLMLSLKAGGDMERIDIRDIYIHTLDKRLQIRARGDICKLNGKKNLTLHFNDIHMDARRGIKEVIVNHFSKKIRLTMIRQMETLGDVHYDGQMFVAFKRVGFSGRLSCKYTKLNFDFSINGYDKMLSGTMNTDSIDLGAIMNVNNIKLGKCSATYSINIANRKNSPVAKRDGRLPIGTVVARINEAKVKFVKFKDIETNVKSDGVTASGMIHLKNSLIDTDVDFDYTQTSKVQNLRVNPKFRLHKKNAKRDTAPESSGSGDGIGKQSSKAADTPDGSPKKSRSLLGRLFNKNKKQ